MHASNWSRSASSAPRSSQRPPGGEGETIQGRPQFRLAVLGHHDTEQAEPGEMLA